MPLTTGEPAVLPDGTVVPYAVLVRAARACHERIVEMQVAAGERDPWPDWDVAYPPGSSPDVSQVTFALRGGAVEEHAEAQWRSWKRLRVSEGWTWGPELDRARKRNPCLTETYAEVPVAQRDKDEAYIDTARAVVGAWRAGRGHRPGGGR